MDERGQQIGPYRLDERLGEGGQSVVWKATDLRSGAVVALKKMREARGQLQHVGRLRREAALLLSFSDPGLPRGIELIDGPEGPVALVLEFIDGQPLHQLLRGPLSAALLWPLFLELTRLVALLHARGVAHRDLKQPNILVRPGWEDGVPGSVVLVDFGIARGNQHFATAYTNTGATLGTCAFMAPELLSGNQDPSPEQFIVGDVYALAVVFWSLLTGLLPNGLPLQASLMQLAHLYARGITFVPEPAQVEAIERAVPGLVRVLERCLAYTPQHRFQHAGELLAALRGLQSGVKVDLAPKGASPQAHTYHSDLPTSALLSAPPGVAMALAPTVLPETVPEPPLFGPTPAPVVSPATTPDPVPTAPAPVQTVPTLAPVPTAPALAPVPPAPVLTPAPMPAVAPAWGATAGPAGAPGPTPGLVLTPGPGRVSAPSWTPEPVAGVGPGATLVAPRGDVGLISKGGVPWFAVGLIAGIGVVFAVVVALVVVMVGWGESGSNPTPTPTTLPTVRAVAPKPLPGPVSTKAATRFATVSPPSGNNNGIVRAGPGQQYAEVEQLPRGTLVRVQASEVGDGWCEVESARGRGFMHRNILNFPGRGGFSGGKKAGYLRGVNARRRRPRWGAWVGGMAAAGVLGWGAPAQAEPTLQQYRMFRALSLDLQGRIPTRGEVASFEMDGFDLDGWIEQRLGGAAYAERLRRIYLDVLRLQIGSTFQFVPGVTTLRRYEVLAEDGKKVVVYFRKGQRRADPLTDGEFCFPKDVTGQTYPSNAAAVGEAKAVPYATLDKYTVKVKPWWLYQDYAQKSPVKRYGEGWGGPGSEFHLSPDLAFEADKTTPVVEVRVCKEEASTPATGTVYTTGLTKKPTAIPEGRFSFPPLDSGFAQKNAGKPISCSIGSSLANAADCGCGVGLERCMPGDTHSFQPNAFLFPSHAQLGDDTAFDATEQAPGAWWRYWWGQEAVRFLDHLFTEDRDFREALTSPATFVNGPLTRFYRSVSQASCCGNGLNLGYSEPEPLFDPKGLPSLLPHQGATWKKVESRGPRASGLLTMPVFLTKYGSRRARAHVLYSAFLCREFVAENVELTPSEEPDLTKRPGCSSCHVALEPMASYFSRVAESDWTFLPESAFPVSNPTCKLDSKGVMSGSCKTYYDPAFSDATAGELRGAHASPANAAAGPAGLATALASAPEFASCAVQNVASSFLGRPLGVDDEALRQQLTQSFQDGGFRMKKLVAALVKSKAYREANNLNSDAWRAAEAP